jgi:predicted phosphodiesterase
MIYFFGDVHGNFGHVRERALADKPEAIVLLGDIEPQRPFEQEIAPLLRAGIDVRWIRGNHDTDTSVNWENLSGGMDLNIDGRIVEIGGLRIAGLGGIFRGEIWYPDKASAGGTDPHFENYEAFCSLQAMQAVGTNKPISAQIRAGKALKHLSTIFWDVYAALWEQQADILVTHEAPSCHPHGFTAIDELAQAMGVNALFHGHHHDSLDYSVWNKKLGFSAYGVGFCGIADQSGKRILAGDFDEVRGYRQTNVNAS